MLPLSIRTPSGLSNINDLWARRSHEGARVLGAMSLRLGMMGASRSYSLHEALFRLGIFGRPPSSWQDSPVLEPMPWGSGRYPAAPPELPLGIDGPWPQKAVVDPRFYSPILNVPPSDRKDHVRYIVLRYLGQLVSELPAASVRARKRDRLVATDDADLGRILTETCFGQFVMPNLDAAVRDAFSHVIAGDENAHAYLDFTVAPTEHLLPRMYAAPVLILVKRVQGRWALVAIRVDRRVVTPSEGDTWTLAKCFALQAAQLRLVTATHPRLHFPADVINAITRSTIPVSHPLHRLIVPHTRFTLGLHESVIHHRRSTIHNSQREVYNPFPYTTEGMHAMVAAGRRGAQGNTAWPEWRFGEDFVGEHVAYGRYRRQWRDAWVQFAAEALVRVSKGDVLVRAWADHIASWLPGFPNGEAIAHGDAFERAVATYLCGISTFHTADHHSYAAIHIEKKPWRLRMSMPASGPVRLDDLNALVAPEDAFRAHLAHAMFFQPALISSLRDIQYPFEHSEERRAVKRWHAAMDTLDMRWGHCGFARSDEIASGVHY